MKQTRDFFNQTLMDFVTFDELTSGYMAGEKSIAFYKKISVLFEKFFHETVELKKPSGNVFEIPKLIHLIWLGPRSYPSYALDVLKEWHRLNPDYKMWLWTDELEDLEKDLKFLEIKRLGRDFELKFLHKEYYAHPSFAGKSDILRIELLYEFGGVYTDYDNRCIKPLDILTSASKFFTCLEWQHDLVIIEDPQTQEMIEPRLANSLIGSIKNHPIFLDNIARMKRIHRFFLKKSPHIQLYQLIMSTYIHHTLSVAAYVLNPLNDSDGIVILPQKLCWGFSRGNQIFNHLEKFFELSYLESVGWSGEFYEFSVLKHQLDQFK